MNSIIILLLISFWMSGFLAGYYLSARRSDKLIHRIMKHQLNETQTSITNRR